MRLLLTGLIALCVLAGLNVRLLAESVDTAAICHDAAHNCCESVPDPCAELHDESCPSGDHHHHQHHACCLHAMPLTQEEPPSCRLGVLGVTLSGIQDDGETAPEEPFLGSEKPPLI